MSFDKQSIRVDDVAAKVGGGDVRFGGRIGLSGYLPGELDLTAVGQQMRLRYPEGFRSTVNADLALTGKLGIGALGLQRRGQNSLLQKQFRGHIGNCDAVGRYQCRGSRRLVRRLDNTPAADLLPTC